MKAARKIALVVAIIGLLLSGCDNEPILPTRVPITPLTMETLTAGTSLEMVPTLTTEEVCPTCEPCLAWKPTPLPDDTQEAACRQFCENLGAASYTWTELVDGHSCRCIAASGNSLGSKFIYEQGKPLE